MRNVISAIGICMGPDVTPLLVPKKFPSAMGIRFNPRIKIMVPVNSGGKKRLSLHVNNPKTKLNTPAKIVIPNIRGKPPVSMARMHAEREAELTVAKLINPEPQKRRLAEARMVEIPTAKSDEARSVPDSCRFKPIALAIVTGTVMLMERMMIICCRADTIKIEVGGV